MSVKRFNLSVNKKIPPFSKTIKVDTDKSISIRSFLIGSICQNISYAKNVLESEDVISTIKCLKKLGVKIVKLKTGYYKIYGKGLGSFYGKENFELNFGNSGTLARLLIGILSTTKGIKVKLKGDKSLNKRNMRQLIDLMSEFGAEFLPKKKYNFPLKLISTDLPIGINYETGVSAQLKSAVMLAGLNSYGNTQVFIKKKSRDHTENMLRGNSQSIKLTKNKILIFGKKNLNPINIDVPGDPSSAAFFTALTLLNKKSYLKIKNICLNKTRIGFYQLLKKRGAKIKFQNMRKKNNEMRGDLIVKSCKLKPINSSKRYYVNSTDEYPILFIIAALTEGVSVFKGIDDLKNKESDRIKEMQKILKQIGVKSRASNGEVKIYGKKITSIKNKGIFVENLGDHRICMSAFVLGVLIGAKTRIKNFETVFTSSPSFLKIMGNLGAKFEKN